MSVKHKLDTLHNHCKCNSHALVFFGVKFMVNENAISIIILQALLIRRNSRIYFMHLHFTHIVLILSKHLPNV